MLEIYSFDSPFLEITEPKMMIRVETMRIGTSGRNPKVRPDGSNSV